MTSHRIGVNLRVSGNCDQGARKYMEDNHVIKFLKKDTDDYEFAYFGIFDGHGGPEASAFCKENLLNEITKYTGFWTDDEEQVLGAIRKGFLDTHNAMWNVLDTWPKTPTGLPSTAGSTATIAIIKEGKLYIGHVGDSALVLGEDDVYGGDDFPYQAVCVTKEHKPDDPDERLRIEDAGGEVINKSGVPRVVWSRPKVNHKGPVRRSTQIDQIPFLAVARSLGDLWSYDFYKETYVVSPDPDVSVVKLDPSKHRCLILASDGLWNMLTPEETVNIVMDLESQFEQKIISDPNVAVSFWSNPAEHLVSRALNKWRAKSLKADNTSCVVVLIDPLGPSKLTLLKRQRQALLSGGEVTGQLTKVTSLPTEVDHWSKVHNKNANCSLSDSHIRVNDDSILRPVVVKEHAAQLPKRNPFGSQPELADSDEEHEGIDVNNTMKAPPVKWNLRHPGEDRRNVPSHTSINHTNRAPPSSTLSHRFSPKKNSDRITGPSFTKLADASKVVGGGSQEQKDRRNTEQIRHRPCDSINDDISMNDVMDELQDDDDNSDYEKTLPKPPPSTPCSGAKEHNDENEKEDSLHSSADVTDIAFSLASEETIDSSESSFGSSGRPQTPLSAPAKLSTNKRGHISKTAKKKLAKSGRMLHSFSKLSSNLNTKIDPSKSPISNATIVKSAAATTEAAKSQINVNFDQAINGNLKGKVTKLTTTDLSKTLPCNTLTLSTAPLPPSDHVSLSQNILNTSKITSNVVTPKSQKEAARSISCSGLTPDMNLLMSRIPRSTLNNTIGTSTISDDVRTHIYSTLMAAGPATCNLRSRREACMIVEDTSMPPPAEPLKQLNKSLSVNKTGSKRWGNFLKASKLGIDQVFHFGSHRKGGTTGSGKLVTTSASKLECGSSTVVNNKRTSMSASRLGDITLNHYLPDVTVSHLTDITLNASTITANDLTNLSALSAEDSILSEDELATVHHSMLDAGMTMKSGKKRKGFFQKTRVTLRRARKAAKKAFFPENHRLFNKPGTKRRSDEFIPAPDMKRQRQIEAEKSRLS